MKRIFIIFALALPFLIAFVFLVAGNRQPPPPESPLPNPNGYDQFIKAAGMLQGDAGNFETMSEAELAALVATNAEALALARSALTNECRVPIQYSTAYLSAHLDDYKALRNLAQGMTAEGRLAEMQNHPAEAAKDYLDVVHFGTESGRGGIRIDAIIGIAIERLGQGQLEKLVNNLDTASCRTTASTLESLDAHRQNWDDVMDRESRYQRQFFPGLKDYLTFWFQMHKDESETRNKARKLFRNQQFKARSLAVQFAARAYELDKGKPPATITDLVPAYLKAVPQDPITGKALVYPPR